ncbi:hypothetical protein TWF718_009772 [Orbilia javanica]|uniref:Uncharacterized protein n=1 Tax=Orbilia javanica TaxID=47235 RepID=A0AAN8RF95_9PEZI
MPRILPTLLLTFFHLLPQTSAYYSIFLRDVGPEWFMAFNYFLSGKNLRSRPPTPTSCQEVPLTRLKGSITALGIYNSPAETPIQALAVYPYKISICGELTPLGAAVNTGSPSFVVILDPRDLYGVNVVDVQKLGIEWYRGAIQPLNVTAERVDPDGLLYGLPDRETSGLYVWEGEPGTNYKTPEWRTWIPNAVEKVPEPRDFLQRIDLENDRTGYVYLRELIERHLRPDMMELRDTVTPWMEKNLEGEFEGIKNKPPLFGPLPRKDPKKERLLIGGNWYVKDVDTPLRREDWETLGYEKLRPPGEDRDGRGWTLSYRGPRAGTIPGMEYYGLKEPIRLDEDVVEEMESDSGDNSGLMQIQPYKDPEDLDEEAYIENSGDSIANGFLEGGDEEDIYVHISDDDEREKEAGGPLASLYRMRRVHEEPGSAVRMKVEEWDGEEKSDGDYGIVFEEEEEDGSILSPVSGNNNNADIPLQLSAEPQPRNPLPNIPAEEEIQIPEAMGEEEEVEVQPSRLNGDNWHPNANVLREELLALNGDQLPRINDPVAAIRAQEVVFSSQNGMQSNFNPFWYPSTSAAGGGSGGDRGRGRRDMMPDIEAEDDVWRSSTSSSRWRNPRALNRGGNLQRSRLAGEDSEDYSYEEYEEMSGRDGNPRGS